MTAPAVRNHWIARAIVVVALVAAIIVCAIAVQQARQAATTNRHAIAEIQHDRQIRLDQINGVALKLCKYAHDNRALQRENIIEQPEVVRVRFTAAGASPAEVERVVVLAQRRSVRLLARYQPVVCPASYVDG